MRTVGGGALAAAVMVLREVRWSSAVEDGTRSSPFYEEAGSTTGVVNDALRGCGIGNCVSTSNSAGSPEDYGPPWRAPEGMTPARAAEAIVACFAESGDAMLTAYRSYTVRGQGDEGRNSKYLRFSAKGLWGDDIIEFLISDDQVLDRNWEGDRAGCIVTYASRGAVKFLYPLTQPLSDFGLQKKRLSTLRQRLNWQIVGCELIECYQ